MADTLSTDDVYRIAQAKRIRHKAESCFVGGIIIANERLSQSLSCRLQGFTITLKGFFYIGSIHLIWDFIIIIS